MDIDRNMKKTKHNLSSLRYPPHATYCKPFLKHLSHILEIQHFSRTIEIPYGIFPVYFPNKLLDF